MNFGGTVLQFVIGTLGKGVNIVYNSPWEGILAAASLVAIPCGISSGPPLELPLLSRTSPQLTSHSDSPTALVSGNERGCLPCGRWLPEEMDVAMELQVQYRWGLHSGFQSSQRETRLGLTVVFAPHQPPTGGLASEAF